MPLTIQYALTKIEIAKTYFVGFAGLSRFRRKILLNVIAVGFLFLLLRIVTVRTITFTDIVVASIFVIAVFLFLPLCLAILGKTGMRTLTVSPEGIYTEIGSLKGQIPWSKIALVGDIGSYVFITRSSGNSFFIPTRAFSSLNQREEFIASIRRWRNDQD